MLCAPLLVRIILVRTDKGNSDPSDHSSRKAAWEDALSTRWLISKTGEVYRAATMAWTVSQQDAKVCKQVLHSCNSFPPDAVEELLQSPPIGSHKPCSQTQANSLCFRFKGQLQKLGEDDTDTTREKNKTQFQINWKVLYMLKTELICHLFWHF